MNRIRSLLIFIVITAGNIPAHGQNVQITSFPQSYQLYPRDLQDSSIVDISGNLRTPGYDSVKVWIEKDGQYLGNLTEPLTYIQGIAEFDFQPKIHAELSNHSFQLFIDGNSIIVADSVVCGDTYIIQGQSNAEAYNLSNERFGARWVRTFGNMSPNPIECQNDTNWHMAIATVWPEYEGHVGIWGLQMAKSIAVNYGIPVCIINGAKGGTTIAQHQKDENNPRNLETIYGRLLYRMQESDIREHAKGIIWHQGENNTYPYNWSDYANQFDLLYNDWMVDYPGVVNVYIFQIRHSFYDAAQMHLRDVQRTIPYNYDNVKIMSTLGIEAHDGLHFYWDGHFEMAERIYPLIARDYYGSADTLNIAPPNILNVSYTSPASDTIAMEFDQEVFWPEDYQGYTMEDHIYLDLSWGFIRRGGVSPANPNTVILALSEPVEARYLTYTPNQSWNNATPTQTYEGPLIKNDRGIDALTFYRFPIESYEDRCLRMSTQSTTTWDNPDPEFRISSSPNPFNPTTTVSYQLSAVSFVNLYVYDITGRKVAELVRGWRDTGVHEVTFEASDLSSGVYLYRLTAGEFTDTGKMVLMK
ncbi:hypothetical protein CEE37_05315 [candidate division LCP-89 bacterium B3_LCP]|uniref:Sialate O-acetylesterase domain-containing protein n=1 Tax=candidate division LCP-89 bacterium B3_LCP TaxID=2012998 RepID=A0A532V265_UNCL8|nr:MAG: hypothetical protein CEE37_05315 [candidate division LCP-89 bacterium B3_LCP]